MTARPLVEKKQSRRIRPRTRPVGLADVSENRGGQRSPILSIRLVFIPGDLPQFHDFQGTATNFPLSLIPHPSIIYFLLSTISMHDMILARARWRDSCRSDGGQDSLVFGETRGKADLSWEMIVVWWLRIRP